MSLRNYTLNLAAGQEITMTVPESNTVTCYEGSSPFIVQPISGEPTELQRGIGFEYEKRFNQLTVRNTAAVAQEIKLYIGSGTVKDARLTASGGINLLAAPVATLLPFAVTNTAVQVDAANGKRSQVLVVNTGINLCYIGISNTVTAANGLPLAAGASLTLTIQSAIWAIAPSGNTEVRVLEESTL